MKGILAAIDADLIANRARQAETAGMTYTTIAGTSQEVAMTGEFFFSGGIRSML